LISAPGFSRIAEQDVTLSRDPEDATVEKGSLKPLHGEGSLSQPKLTAFRKLSTEDLIGSLRPEEPGALKVKPDGTIMDGHHRVFVLRERGVDVDALPRESLE
jgi:hypothetical protein